VVSGGIARKGKNVLSQRGIQVLIQTEQIDLHELFRAASLPAGQEGHTMIDFILPGSPALWARNFMIHPQGVKSH
jgi:hypothetical protein